jgi:lipid A 3-O-deacylase
MSVVGVVLLSASPRAQAEGSLLENLWGAVRGKVPHETAVGLYAGTAYDWSDMDFALLNCQALFDYDKIWPHRAPEGLGIRFEANVGAAAGSDFSGERLVASAGFLAVYEFGSPKRSRIVPYIEAGVEGIYTDFQREDQSSRVNFNPVAGIGVRIGSGFLVLRAHHVSNAGTNEPNRGINSVLLGVGFYL